MKVQELKRILSTLDDDVDIYVDYELEKYEPKISSMYDTDLDEYYYLITNKGVC